MTGMKELASALCASPLRHTAVAEAADAVRHGSSKDLFEALFDSLPEVYPAMGVLERLFDADPVVGGTLMAHLYPIASRARMHDVCDAIELWMHHKGNAALAQTLRDNHHAEQDEALQRKHQMWIEWCAAGGQPV
jgi:hypothetical protein